MNNFFLKNCAALVLTAAGLTFPHVSAAEPEAVDPGTGVKFASGVLGASDSNPFSTFFWGEVEPSSMTQTSEMQKVDMNEDISGTLYDAAYIMLGDKWRMPTATELESLAACDWQPATVNGREGWTVSGEGGSIFIPKTGTSSGVPVATLWSSTCVYNALAMPNWKVRVLSFRGSDKPVMAEKNKEAGGIILPVLNERSGTKVGSLSLVESSVKARAGKTVRIYPKIGPADAANKKLVWTSDNQEIATVSDMGVVTCVAAGETSVTVSTADGSDLSVKCAVTVEAAPEPVERKVDLGLSVIWSAYNLGSDGTPTSVGEYYSFAELEPKESYARNNYAHFKGFFYSIPVGNIQGTEYDAAKKAWGESWCIPTKEQIDELIANCTSELEYIGDVRGYRFTSKINGNSIFIPAGGYKIYNETRENGMQVFAWSASVKTGSGPSAWAYCLSNNRSSSKEPECGMPIRPVFLPEKEVTAIEIEPAEISMVIGATEKLKAIVQTSDGSEAEVEWSSDAQEIATVDADGLVTALAVGNAIITAKAGQKTAECNVTVVEDISTGIDMTIAEGETGDVYSISGVKLLSNVQVKADMPLQPGVYIIRYRSGRTQKIVIY